MSERGVWAQRMMNSRYRQTDPLKGLLEGGDFRPIERSKGQVNPPPTKSKRFILGYTGFIPGMSYSYGKSYGTLADENIKKFDVQRASSEGSKTLNSSWKRRARGDIKFQSSYPEDKLRKALLDLNTEKHYRNEHISPEQPPISGYTGHIPRIKSSETSLSQRYHEAARRGLYLLQQDREKFRNLHSLPPTSYQTPVY